MAFTGSSQALFLGVTVNPKLHMPVYAFRMPGTYKTVRVFSYEDGYPIYIGEGYIDGDDDLESNKYLQAVKATGFPRSHTPAGVRSQYQGLGFGTCLYTGILMLASAISRGIINSGHIEGKGEGICSSKGTRSVQADTWWNDAVGRKIAVRDTYEIDGNDDDEPEEEEETDEDEDLTDHMSFRDQQKVFEVIQEAVGNNGEGWPTNIVIRGDIVRTVYRERQDASEIVADYYTLTSAEKYKLIALQATFGGGGVREASDNWMNSSSRNPDPENRYYKDAILGLNVSQENPFMAAKLAQCAKAAGATDDEASAFMLRNKLGLDMLKGAAGLTSVDLLRLDRPEGTILRSPGRTQATQNPSKRRRHKGPPMREPGSNYRRNPEPTRTEQRVLDREAERLADRRERLGWDALEDMP